MFGLGLLGVIFVLGLLISLAGQDELSNGPKLPPSELPFELSFQNLQPTASGSYELWLVRGDTAWSFGRFETNDTGDGFVADTQLEAITTQAQDGDQIVITLESDRETNNQPSAVVVLSGLIGAETPSQAELEYPVDLSQVSGSYILATPTNDPEAHETAGIWLTTPTGSAPTVVLPSLPEGWVYQLWAEHGGVLLNGGRFTAADQADNFAGFSGEGSGPNYPGEDYVRNLPPPFNQPLELADGNSRIFISLEPDLDGVDPSDLPSATPSASRFLTFLTALIPAAAQDHTTYQLEPYHQPPPAGLLKLTN